jgi:hypothetical protein
MRVDEGDIQPLEKKQGFSFIERLNINPHQPYQPSSTIFNSALTNFKINFDGFDC